MKTDMYHDILLDFISETLPCKEVEKLNSAITNRRNYQKILSKMKKNIKNDKSLQNQITFRKDLKTALEDIEQVDDIRNKIQKIYNKKIVKIPSYIKWATAASFVLMTIFVANLYYQRMNVSPDKIYNDYYKPYYRNSSTRTSDSDILKIARDKYEKGSFNEALLIFENIPESINIESEILFYKGLSNMELKDFPKAIKYLQKLQLEYPQSTWANYATWYLGLSYLKTGSKSKAISSLEQVKENKFLNHEKASKILKKLK